MQPTPEQEKSNVAISCPTCLRAVDATTTKCVYDGTALNCINTDPVLRTRYDRLEEMAQGGMGIIYKAHDVAKKRIVAIKTMHLHVMTPISLERFRMEGKATATLAHPNIVVIHDFGVAASGQPYLVMDYLPGESLDQLLRREITLNSSSFFSVFSQVCQALVHAHRRSILHRDIKPGNIMLTRDQSGHLHVTVLDFGIARMLDDQYEAQKMTRTGEIIGSPIYMSPEQVCGVKTDQRSDIYSLGCVMYEALSGVPPFYGKTSLETMFMHKNDAVLPMSEASMGKKVDPQLEQFVLRLLEKNPADRYQSMSAVADDLHSLETGRSIKRASSEPIAAKTGSKRTGSMAIVAGLALAAAGAIFFAYTQYYRRPQAPPNVVPGAGLRSQELGGFHDDKKEIQRLIGECFERHSASLDLTAVNVPVTNEDLAPLKAATFLTRLSINHGTINDDGLEALRNLPLEELRLQSTRVRNLKALQDMKTLTQLELQESPIGAAGLKVISHLTGLDHLNLSQTPVRDQDLKALYGLTNLRTLELFDCPNISEPALEQLKKTLNQCEITSEADSAGTLTDQLAHEEAEMLSGRTMAQRGEYEQASTEFQKLITKLRAERVPEWTTLTAALGYLADCQSNLHRYKQAAAARQEELSIQSEHGRLFPEMPRAYAHTATLYEKWNLAAPDLKNLKAAIDLRLKSEEIAAKLADEETAEARPANLAALAHDYVMQKNYERAGLTYKQFSEFGLPTTLLNTLAEALDDEAGKKIAKAIALRQNAEEVFAKPGFAGSATYGLLHAQNLEQLGADLMPDYAKACPFLNQAASYYANAKLVPSSEFLSNLEKTADHQRGKSPEESLKLFKSAETAYSAVGRAADATRLSKKIQLLQH